MRILRLYIGLIQGILINAIHKFVGSPGFHQDLNIHFDADEYIYIYLYIYIYIYFHKFIYIYIYIYIQI